MHFFTIKGYNITNRYLDPISIPDIVEGRYMLRDFFLGFIKIHILYHAAREPVYGAELIAELACHGYEISPGTLYPTLHFLEKKGFLKSREKNVDGKLRKYYSITEEGRTALEESKEKIRELVKEVLEG